MKRRLRVLLAVGAGLALAGTAHVTSLWILGVLAFVLWSLALENTRALEGFFVSFFVGLASTLALWHWLPETVVRFTGLSLGAGFVAWVLFCAVSSVSFGLVGLFSSWTRPVLGHAIALGASAWLVEAWGPQIFPWQPAASLIEMPWLPMSASLLGVSGLGAVMLAVSTVATRAALHRARPAWAAAWSLPRPSRTHGFAALGVFIALVAYGAVDTARVRAARARAPRAQVALVQSGIAPLVRWDPRAAAMVHMRLHALTLRAREQNPALSLVVWPEGAFPYPLPYARTTDGEFSPNVYLPGSPANPPAILFGAVARDDARDRAYNAAFLREPDGAVGPPVAKRWLVPFGEHVPLVGELSFVRRVLARAYGLWPGTQRTVLRTRAGLRMGVLNCVEDMIPWVAADVADAELLVNITNDSWFGDGRGPLEHLMLARWRAIETHRDLLRAVTRGVTSHVTALGTVETHLRHAEADVLQTHPARLDGWTPARVVIPWAPWGLSGLLSGALVLRVLRARRRGARSGPSEPVAG